MNRPHSSSVEQQEKSMLIAFTNISLFSDTSDYSTVAGERVTFRSHTLMSHDARGSEK